MSQVQTAIKECSVEEQIKYEKSKAKRRKRADFDQQMVDREEEMKEREKTEQSKQQRRLERRKQKLLEEAKRQEQNLKEKEEQERQNLEGLVEQKKKQLEISDQNERLAIENSNLDEDEKTRLIQQWEKEQKKKQHDLKVKSEKSKADLERRIAERRKREQTKSEQRMLQIDEKKTNKAEKVVKNVTTEEKLETTEKPETPNFGEIILKSGLLEKLESLHGTLENAISSGNVENNGIQHPLFMAKSEFDKRTDGKIVEHSALSAKEFLAVKYLERQCELLGNSFRLGHVKVHVVTSLPKTNGESFMPNFYIFANANLFVPREVLDSTSLVSIIAAHCQSHRASNATFNDTDIVFKRAFFRAIALLSANMMNSSLSIGDKELLDFSKEGADHRRVKYREHSAMNRSREHAKNIKKTQDLMKENLNKMSIVEDSPNRLLAPISIESNTEFLDHLYELLYDALESNNENEISRLQKEILKHSE